MKRKISCDSALGDPTLQRTNGGPAAARGEEFSYYWRISAATIFHLWRWRAHTWSRAGSAPSSAS